MLDIKLIRENPEFVKEGICKKNVDVDVDKILETDKRYRHILKELESARAEHNKKSKERVKSDKEIAELRKLKEKIKVLEKELDLVKEELNNFLLKLPNLPLPDVPVGKSGKDNVVLYEVGIDGKKSKIGESKKPKFEFKPKKHFELGESLDVIDTKRAAKVSGSRFGYLKGQAAILEFALIKFVVERLTNKKWIEKIIKQNNLDVPVKEFIPVVPPVLIKPEMMKGMGYINESPAIQGSIDGKKQEVKPEDEVYYIEKDNLVLVGTSEQSIGPMHSKEIFEQKDLPIRYLGFSSCFRREAGSYGKDVRGILRSHQFDKLEMFSYSLPEKSIEEHKLFLAIEEKLVRELKLAYRVVQLSTADIAAPSANTIDIEVWFPGLGEYRETHSSSNTTDFQARRLNIRYREKSGKLNFVHMLNGTAVAIGRMILAILENYQEKNGTVKINFLKL